MRGTLSPPSGARTIRSGRWREGQMSVGAREDGHTTPWLGWLKPSPNVGGWGRGTRGFIQSQQLQQSSGNAHTCVMGPTQPSSQTHSVVHVGE